HLVSAAPSNTDRRAEELHPAQDEARDPAVLARYLKLYGDERMVLERRRRTGAAGLPEGSAIKSQHRRLKRLRRGKRSTEFPLRRHPLLLEDDLERTVQPIFEQQTLHIAQ